MSTESNDKKLTDWEIGQELTKVFDTMQHLWILLAKNGR